MSNSSSVPPGTRVRDHRKPGWFWLDNEVIDKYAAKMKPIALACYVYLCRRANENGRCWPAQRTMAEDLGVERGTVRTAVKQLVDLKLIHLEVRRNEDGSYRSTIYTLLDVSAASEGGGPLAQDGLTAQGGPYGPEEDSLKDSSSKETNVSLSGDGQKAAPPDAKSQDLKQYAVAQLMERVAAAQARGAPVHDPLGSDRGQYGKFFAARSKKYDVDTLLMTLDYLVAKASGEVENEPKAWCGFDTALDAVLLGWRPKRALRVVRSGGEPDPEWDELMRLQAEMIAGAS